MSFKYKVIITVCIVLAIECCFWSMWDTQVLQDNYKRIEQLEKQQDTLLELLSILKEEKYNDKKNNNKN